jgi:hypothetical protein
MGATSTIVSKPHKRPVWFLACPARFERATYALEAIKLMQNNKLHNSISPARSGAAYAPRSVVRSGIGWILLGIGRRLSGRMCILSG